MFYAKFEPLLSVSYLCDRCFNLTFEQTLSSPLVAVFEAASVVLDAFVDAGLWSCPERCRRRCPQDPMIANLTQESAPCRLLIVLTLAML